MTDDPRLHQGRDRSAWSHRSVQLEYVPLTAPEPQLLPGQEFAHGYRRPSPRAGEWAREMLAGFNDPPSWLKITSSLHKSGDRGQRRLNAIVGRQSVVGRCLARSKVGRGRF